MEMQVRCLSISSSAVPDVLQYWKNTMALSKGCQKTARKEKMMKKKFLFLFMIGAIILVCCHFRFSGTTEDCRFSLNQKDIPYVMQEGKTYLFLEDILKNGFVLEPFSGGYQDDNTVYRYVLWTVSANDKM